MAERQFEKISTIYSVKQPLVAICIPTYEKVELFDRVIKSIQEQTYSNYIIFVTDNSETDIISEYIKSVTNSRIIYHHNLNNLGASENTNLSIKLALKKGVDVIKIIYQDDWFAKKNSLEKMVYKLVESGADVVCTGNIEAYPKDNRERICTKEQIEAIKTDITSVYRGNILGAPSNILYKASNVFFDSNFSWLLDVDFYMRLLIEKRLEYIYEPLITIGHDGAQLTDYYKIHPELMLKENVSLYFKYNKLHTLDNTRHFIQIIWICSKLVIKKSIVRLTKRYRLRKIRLEK